MQVRVRFGRLTAGIVLVILAAAVAGLRAQVPVGILLQAGDLQYIGAFRVPIEGVSDPGTTGAYTDCGYVTNPPTAVVNGFEWSEAGMAFNPERRSLFINTHVYEQKTAEIAIPTELGTSRTINDLPRAPLLHRPVDLSQGNLWKFGLNGACHQDGMGNHIGGLLVWKNKLVADVFGEYSPASTIERSHFTHSLNLDAQDFAGIFSLESKQPYPGTSVLLGSSFFAGAMAHVPAEWQTALGGPVLTGQCCLSMIARTSYGPSLFAFNPDDLGTTNPVPHTPLLFYPSDHPTLGTWEDMSSINLRYNMMTFAKGGIVFPTGSGSVLVFGTQATNGVCYGGGTTDPALHKQPWQGGQIWCYDPYRTDSVGPHAFPNADGSDALKAWVWAYSAVDLARVKSGQAAPWELKPYAVWDLRNPFGGNQVQAVAYDTVTQRLYVAFHLGDGAWPLIAVYKLNLSGSQPPPVDPPPTQPPPSSSTDSPSPSTSDSSSSFTSTTLPVSTGASTDGSNDASRVTLVGNVPTAESTTTLPLTLSCPTIATVTSANGNPTTVTFASPVATGGAAPLTTSCLPGSGSQFPVGSTPVTCGASDVLGRTASCTTTVTVIRPSPTRDRVQRRLRRYRRE